MSTLTGDITRERLDEAGAAREVAVPRRRRKYTPQRLAAMTEARDLFHRTCDGDKRAAITFQEALSTSDFQFVFGDVLDRELLNGYQSLQPIWPQFARRGSVMDFRAKKYIDLLGGQGLLEKVEQLAPYPQRSPKDNQYTLKVDKYGGRISLSWEDTINDDLDALRNLPQGLAQGAHDTEDYIATGLVASATGPNAAFFNSTALANVTQAGGSNLLTANPALTVDSLSAALTTITSRRDVDNRPMAISGFILMVPPSLMVAANNILNATQIRIGNTAVTNGEQIIVGNWLANKVTLVVNPWLPVVDVSGNSATTWYLLPQPTSSRPGVVLGFLRGHETPDLRVKADAGNSLGGGAVPAEEGSFDYDDIAYRVRHVLGGTTLDPIATAVSNGSGS